MFIFRNFALSLVILQLLLLTGIAVPQPSGARNTDTGYQGIEFYGSSLITKAELEKLAAIKPGASYEQTQKALMRLKEKLAQRHIENNATIATEEGDRYYLAVDVVDTGSAGTPVRKIEFPHHIILSSELPFQLFNELLERREMLAQQGRPVTESYDQSGIKHYSDEPCNQYGDKLHRQVPHMQRELLNVINYDPDPDRRSNAIEVLNWTSDPIILCVTFIPAIDDASQKARASIDRFIFPRIKMLPDNYPFLDLVDKLSHQLARPSYLDRSLALRCLCEIARTHPEAIDAIKEFDEDKVKQLAQDTVLNSIKAPAQQLLSYCANAPRRRAPRVPVNEF